MTRPITSPDAMPMGRRDFLALATSGTAWLLLPWRASATYESLPALPPLVDRNRPSLADFVRLSRTLTGHAELDSGMAERIYRLILAEPWGSQHVAQVYEKIQAAVARDPTRTREQVVRPDAFQSGEQWFISHVLVTWYTGVYYHETGHQGVGFEHALIHQTLLDLMPIPTLCDKVPGFWADPPAAAGAGK